jgi:single-stranded-DNA-specific exonuclease
LEIEAASLDDFRRAFCEHAASALGGEPPAPAEEIDAVVGCESLGLDVARQLGRLGPFGNGNPEIRLLVPGARLADVRPMGTGERHARFTLASGARRALGVAFGVNGDLGAAAAAEDPVDVSVGLEVNHWNGSVEPRVVLGRLYAPPSGSEENGLSRPADEEWWARVEAELAVDPERSGDPGAAPSERREVIDRRGDAGVAAVAALASAGGAILVVACDALRRRELVERAATPARFGGGRLALVSARLADSGVATGTEAVLADGGVVLADWPALARIPGLAGRFEHIVAIDPPPSEELERMVGAGDGFLHLLWGEGHVPIACRAHEAEWPSRAVLTAIYRALGADAPAARAALAGPEPYERAPEAAARCLRVLREIGAVEHADPHERALGAVSSDVRELERSPSFTAYGARSQEGIRFLSRRQAS